MKILMLTTELVRLNGAERLSVEIAEALNAQDGFQVELASIYGRDFPGISEAEECLKSRGIGRVHYLGLEVHSRPWRVLKAIWRLRRLLRDETYDIIESSLSSPAILASWAAWGLKTRHVSGIHNAYNRARFNRPRHRIWRFSVRGSRCAHFYAISDFVRDCWIEYARIWPEKICTIYNGIPDHCFGVIPDRENVRNELGIPRDARIALFVGRLLMRKGIDTILDALGPILLKEDLHLVYVGDWYPSEGLFQGEDNLRNRLEQRCVDEEWGKRVHFIGRRDDVSRLMASSDVLVHPARLEGFGLILAEAMAAGLFIVASNVEGIPEILAGTDSLMVPPDDANALRAAVLEALNRSPEAASRAAERGRKRAEDFRIHNRIEAMIRLFRNVSEQS